MSIVVSLHSSMMKVIELMIELIYSWYANIFCSFYPNNFKNLFFALCLNVFTLLYSLTSSGKPLQIKDPNTTNNSDEEL